MGTLRVIKPGDVVGRLTVTRECRRNRHGQLQYLCLCECGDEKYINAQSLSNGNTSSCGCLRRERISECNSTHRMSGTRLYRIWRDMRTRTSNPESAAYHQYGGRGIRCHLALETFEGFMDNIPDGYHDNLTLDRINVDGDYEPGNLRWSTQREQQNNRRNNRLVELSDAVRRTVAEASRMFGIPASVIYERINNGWDHYDAVTTPVGQRR